MRFVSESQEGARNARLYWAACRAADRGVLGQLRDALGAAAVQTGLPRHEVEATIRSAERAERRPVESPEGWQAPEVSTLAEVEPERPGSDVLAYVTTGAQLDAKTFPPLAWSVPGIIPEGFGLLVGAPKLGKSWLALGVGLAIAAGSRALGAIDTGNPRPVLYLALEDGERRLQGRCRTLLGPGRPIPDRLHVVTRLPPNVPVTEFVAAWLERFADRDPLVLVDTLGKVMPPSAPGESAYQRDYRVGGSLKRLTDDHPGATLLVVHHNRKAEGADWMDSTSGTQGLNGAADFTIVLTRSRNSTDALLKVTGRDVPENEYGMHAENGTWQLAGGSLEDAAQAARAVAASAGVGDDMARIVAWVSVQRAPVTPGMVSAALDLDTAMVGRYLRRAVESGRIRRPARGYYGPLSEVSEVSGTSNVRHLFGPEPTETDTTDTTDTPLGEDW